MRSLSVFAATLLLLSVGSASAFSTDDRTLNDSSGQPKFSDPDDQTPSPIFQSGNASAHFGGSNDNSQPQGNYGTTSAPFSPSNGGFIPQH